MIVNQVGVVGQVKLANINQYTGIDVVKSQNVGDFLHITGEAGPTNAGPWTVFENITIFGGPGLPQFPNTPINIRAQIPADPSYIWGRLNVIEVIGSWDITPSIT